jgi:hypothetical protein
VWKSRLRTHFLETFWKKPLPEDTHIISSAGEFGAEHLIRMHAAALTSSPFAPSERERSVFVIWCRLNSLRNNKRIRVQQHGGGSEMKHVIIFIWEIPGITLRHAHSTRRADDILASLPKFLSLSAFTYSLVWASFVSQSVSVYIRDCGSTPSERRKLESIKLHYLLRISIDGEGFSTVSAAALPAPPRRRHYCIFHARLPPGVPYQR